MGRLDGKTALVTGGAVGIGAACARRMVEAGARVAIVDVHDEAGQRLAAELGDHARYLHADVSAEAEVAAAVTATVAAFGGLNVLVNNAGIAGPNKPTHELTEAEWDRVQAVNVKGVFFGTKHAIAPMRAAGGGSIINLSSIYGLVGAPDVPPYHASKGAVRLMSKTDALLYAADGIRVNSIHPASSGHPWSSSTSPRWVATRSSTGATPPRCTRWATWASRTTSPGACSTWPRTNPALSPAASW